MSVLYLIKTRLNFTSNFWDKNNLKSKYYYTMMRMLRALCLVVAHDLSKYMDEVTRNLFSLFCSTWRAVLKMFVRLLRMKASETLEKRSTCRSYLQERKMEKRGQKELLTTLECLNYKKSSQHRCSALIRNSTFERGLTCHKFDIKK